MPEPLINPQRVEELFMDCLFREGEPTDKHVKAEGIICTVGFHPLRLESHRDEVKKMLSALPPQFFPVAAGGGGGWSFLNLGMDKNETQWTGHHQRMEQLVQLGLGLGLVTCQLPRSMWPTLPGGVPYYEVNPQKDCLP